MSADLPAPPPRRVLLIDDHEIIRKGVRRIVERESGWEVCGEAGDGREGVALAEKTKPDIVVLDIAMPGLNGLEATRQLKKRLPNVEVLIFSGNETREIIQEAFEAGARSFLSKTDITSHLTTALRALAIHKPYFTEKVADIVFERFLTKAGPGEKKKKDAPGEALTPREREIVQLVAEGQSSKEIAETLGISLKTIETHRAAVMRKLRLQSLPELVRYAIRTGIIQA
jgi:DNA-binding NarL/FixJ family response regulator